jgi:hypothetical protein
VRHWVALALVVVAACKGKGKVDEKPTPGSGSGQPVVADAAAVPDAWAIIDACRPCGDWTPILDWQKLPADGGPTRTQIENAMVGCKAYCEPNAKMRFLGTLDDARMKGARTPWRELGEMCREQVSAVPDARYMSASYFALDRIARDVAARPNGADLLSLIEIPMLPVSVSAVGIKIPDSPVSAPQLVRLGVTVTMKEISIGTLPVATLGAAGVTIAGDLFPGKAITLKDLPDALEKANTDTALFAPSEMPASRIANVFAVVAKPRVMLAVTSVSGLYGVVPVYLQSPASRATKGLTFKLGATPEDAINAIKDAGRDNLYKGIPLIEIDKATTVAGLARTIGALAFFGVRVVALAPPKP